VQRKLGKFGGVKKTEERLCCVVMSFLRTLSGCHRCLSSDSARCMHTELTIVRLCCITCDPHQEEAFRSRAFVRFRGR
jgi:hypothetical protein